MSMRFHRAMALAAMALAALLVSPAARADPDARLPRPRPAVEAQSATSPETGAWAGELQSRFRVAAAAHEDAPAVERTAPTESSAFEAIERLARLPRARPEHPAELLAMVPQERPERERPAPPLAPRVPELEDMACLARIEALGVRYTKAESIDPQGPCNVDHPLTVTALGMGVRITPQATLNCRTAEALALWTRDELVPAARDILGATPTRIVQNSTYVCRYRNNDPDAKISEHAHANAVDIGSIGFAEREPFNVADRDMSSLEGRFQVTIRGGSCDHFTTVLGPRSNAAHATHFHFDMAQRRGGYRLCDLADTNFVGATEP
jgi:hypothetical protein